MLLHLCVHPPIVARQWLGEHVPVATKYWWGWRFLHSPCHFKWNQVISSYQNFLFVLKLTTTIFMFQVDYSVLKSPLIIFHWNIFVGSSLTVFHLKNISVWTKFTEHVLFGIVFLCSLLFTHIIYTNGEKSTELKWMSHGWKVEIDCAIK